MSIKQTKISILREFENKIEILQQKKFAVVRPKIATFCLTTFLTNDASARKRQ